MIEEMFDNEIFAALPQARELRRYMEEGRPVNHFLTYLIQNDLVRCIGRADSENLAALPNYCTWLHSYAPPMSFGSEQKMQRWIAHNGLSGL